jgi:hypothetical protein
MIKIQLARWYVLDGKVPRRARSLFEGAQAFEDIKRRRVAETYIDGVRISTVFLGLDHQLLDGGAPLLFETMVFGGALDHAMKRYSTWDQAEAGHGAMEQAVKRTGNGELHDQV